MFRLSKWYLDCVAQDGSAFFAYSARLAWGALRVRYAATLLARPGEPVLEAHTPRDAPPSLADGDVSWRSQTLGVRGRWRALVDPVHRRLLDSPGGAVLWRCHQPSACARVELGGLVLEGFGYVEELELTIPPWKVPMDVLLWGRFAADGHALTWIEWRGPEPRKLVLHNGKEASDAVVRDSSVLLPSDHTELLLETPRILREGALGRVASAVPLLPRLLPSRMTRAHESKRLSAATLRQGGERVAAGWAIHEVVRWH